MVASSFKKASFNKATGMSTSTGNKGPASTTPKHGKKVAWFQLYDSHGAYMDSQKKGARKDGGRKKRDEGGEDLSVSAAA